MIKNQYDIVILNLNLSSIKIIDLKKNLDFKFKFLKKKVKYNNLTLYGNFIKLTTGKKKINLVYPLIPIIYIYNNKNISIKKHNQLKKQNIFSNIHINFFNTFKKI